VKKLLALPLLLVAVPALAQLGSPPGIPASATSITPRNPTPGVPASVTSFSAFHPPASTGFTAFNLPPSTSFTAFHPPGLPSRDVSVDFGVSFGGGRRHHSGFRSRGVVVAPVYYPVYYPVYAQPEPEPAPELQPDIPSGNALERELWSRAAERSDRALDRRDAYLANEDPRYGEHYLDSRERASIENDSRARRPYSAGDQAAAPEPPAPVETQLVLVLRDGSRLELGNYAIVGQTVYDLNGSRRGRKIQLAELDMTATQKANDVLGFDFKLPTAAR
jgi:hypothetical protein